MIFLKAERDENFDIAHFISKEGNWEMGLTQMLFGVRVRVGVVGSDFVALDLCAGPDPDYQKELLRCVFIILWNVPETITQSEMFDMFPICKRKPIYEDECWAKIQQMTVEAWKKMTAPPPSITGESLFVGHRKLTEIIPDPS